MPFKKLGYTSVNENFSLWATVKPCVVTVCVARIGSVDVKTVVQWTYVETSFSFDLWFSWM